MTQTATGKRSCVFLTVRMISALSGMKIHHELNHCGHPCPTDPRQPRKPDHRGRRGVGRRLLRPRRGAQRSQHRAYTRPGSFATATRRKYLGRGVLQAVDNVNEKLADEICGLDALDQTGLDQSHDRIGRDGEREKPRRPTPFWAFRWPPPMPAADYTGLPLFRYLGGVGAPLLPAPMMNILNGGKHADNAVDFQEFMVMPLGALVRRGHSLRRRDVPRLERHSPQARLRHERGRRRRIRPQPAKQ